MSPVFIITLVLLAAIAYTIYHKQRQYDDGPPYELRGAEPRTLFAARDADEPEHDAQDEQGRAALPAPAEGSAAVPARAALLERAAQGDLDALADARRLGDQASYDETLAALVGWAGGSRERVDALAEFVCRGENLRGSTGLSRAFSGVFEESADAASTARALHLAALSDDAEEFSRVLDEIVRLRREAKLPALSSEDLRALVESQFWVLSASARASGAAFVLKQKIAALRNEPSARV